VYDIMSSVTGTNRAFTNYFQSAQVVFSLHRLCAFSAPFNYILHLLHYRE
jgi:hypothetical protein